MFSLIAQEKGMWTPLKVDRNSWQVKEECFIPIWQILLKQLTDFDTSVNTPRKCWEIEALIIKKT